MYTGFYMKKGFGRAVATVPGVRKGSIMDSDWYWKGFIDRLRENQYEEMMRRALELSNEGLWILLEAWSLNKPPALDTKRAGSDNSLLFVISDSSLHLVHCIAMLPQITWRVSARESWLRADRTGDGRCKRALPS